MNFQWRRKITIGLLFLTSALFLLSPVQAQTLPQRLAGRILLQVESHGEAWYVNPINLKRYYLGRPSDALELMRQLSLGISEVEFATWSQGAPTWARGRLFLRPESHGEAYYVDLDQRWHYLGRPDDAWKLLRNQGLGITNADLNNISLANPDPTPLLTNPSLPSNSLNLDVSRSLSWKYEKENYEQSFLLSSELNNDYSQSLKILYYNNEADLQSVREKFYGLFLKSKDDDFLISDLANFVRETGKNRAWNSDQIAEFALALVQYIPYDESKVSQSPLIPNYPYETVYKNSGVCSDKVFLAISLLRELGYGGAILDFPDENHSAVGIACPVADSLMASGYCFVETTNYFPLGVVPASISSGQAVGGAEAIGVLFTADHLGRLEIYQKTEGIIYQGVGATKEKVATLKNDYSLLSDQKEALLVFSNRLSTEQESLGDQRRQLDTYFAIGDFRAYNQGVGVYNQAVNDYNNNLGIYRQQQKEYNNLVERYNQKITDFYQK